MKKLKFASEKGFTLVEIIIAIVIISAVLSAAIPLFIKAIALNKSAKNKLIAYELAQKKVEDLRNSSFDTIYASYFSIPEIPNGAGTIEVSNDINDDGNDEENIKKITISANWQEKSENKNIQLITYITKQGITN